MTTKQIEPDVDAWREQEKHQRRSSRNKRVGAFAVAAAIGLAAVVLVLSNRTDPGSNRPAVEPSPTPLVEISRASFLDLRTGEPTPLPESVFGGALYSVSPDRTQLVYSYCCTSLNPVFVANVDGTGVRQITPDGVDGFGAGWSPDGSTVVYQRRNGATTEIGNLVVADVATGATTQITDFDPESYGWWFLSPSFSPDGETVIFHRPRGPDDNVNTRWDLWSVPVTGGRSTVIVPNASMGVYSPDGLTLAYLDSPRGYWSSSRLMVADVDGSDPRVLAQGDGIEFPRWSPDGTSIAYTDRDGIHVVDVATGETSLVARDGVVDWFDDDTLVVAP